MKTVKILAIESSCDETAVAITEDGKLLANVVATQIAVHEKYGGVMPEIASRLHCENIGVCLKEALETAHMKYEDLDAIAVTRGPGLIGCLHVGMQAAKTIAMLYHKPLIPVHHLCGHIYANEYVGELKFPLLCVVVSGGNTELVLMKNQLDFEIIGETKDDAVGECYDKVARVLGLPYPGGLPIDQHAKKGQHTYDLPKPLQGKGYDFSYSGLKTAVINVANTAKMKGEELRIDDMARSFQDVAVGMIIDRAVKAAKEYDVVQVVLAGGVSANSYLREEMQKRFPKGGKVELIIPPIWCTTDNAAMIAKVAEHLYKEKFFAPLSIGVDPNWKIDQFRDYNT